MSQAVKYALLGAALVTVFSLFVALIAFVPIGDITSGFASSVASVMSIAGNFFRTARGIVNHFFDPAIVSFFLWLLVISPFSKWGMRLFIMVYRWLNQ